MFNRFRGQKGFSLRSVLSFLEDSKYPSVGPHLRFLGLTGLWHPNLDSKVTRFKQYLFYVIVAFFFSIYVKCFINFKTSSIVLILQYAPFHIGIVKAFFFQKHYNMWEKIINYISQVERKQIDNGDEETNKIIDKYITHSRRISYFFWTLAFFSNFSIFSEPYQKNEINVNGTSVYLNMFDGYTPFSPEPPGYYISMFIQTVLGNVVSAYIVAWDALICTIMIHFAGQLRITRLICSRAIEAGNVENSSKNIAECHHFHTTLVKNQKVFNELISPAMTVYMIFISVNLGVNIIQIAQVNNDLATILSSCIFMVACLTQLLLFYWHSNEVTEQSYLVSYGTFESDWFEMDNKWQREVALLGVTTRKRLMFNAGPFNEMTLSTFIGILRASYSFYTLLKETH